MLPAMQAQRVLALDAVPPVQRGHPIICLLCAQAPDGASRSLHSLCATVPAQTPILVIGLEQPLEQSDLVRARDDGRAVLFVAAPDGEIPVLNGIVESHDADLLLAWSGAEFGEDALERLRAAAHYDSTVASASALSSRPGPLAVAPAPLKDPRTLPSRGDAARAARAVAELARCAYPRIGGPQPPCVYVRREVLELLGPFGGASAEILPALQRFGEEALAHGMLHVVADDVYVTVETGVAGRPGGDASSTADDAHAAEAQAGLDGDERSALSRCVTTAQAALDGLSVTIDARALAGPLAGTQVYTTELVLALARLEELPLRVVVPPDLSPAANEAFAGLHGVQLVSYAEVAAGGLPRSHVVHRPQQVFSEDDLALLRLMGERVVVGQQDLIAYHNPTYHASSGDWQHHRRVTRLALAVADRVVFFSSHAMRDALAEDLTDPARAVHVAIGGDEIWSRGPVTPTRPAGAPDGPFLLMLGMDYRHKNRTFAIALVRELLRTSAWRGRLILAGGHVAFGSSLDEQQAQLAADPKLQEIVIDLGPVDEAGRAWLMEHADAVLYPSLYEGFGLLPAEALRAGTPCLFAPQASLAETAAAAATLVQWDANASAHAVAPLLVDGPARERHLRVLRESVASHTWAAVADELRGVYEQAVSAPHRSAAPRAWQELERERHIRELNESRAELMRQLAELRESVGALAGPELGGLLSEVERRGLLRVASRPSLHRLLLKPISLLGRRW
jgi:glycosyltransferase involved in cell wall biosynthesis